VMSSFILDIIKSLLIGAGVFGITAWITVKLALRRFYTEKWWERKAQAYSETIGSLAKMRVCFDKWEEELFGHKDMSPETRKKVNEEYANVKRVVENAVAAGSFIVSEEAAQVLGSFLKELQKEDIQGNWLNDLDRHHSEVIRCIARLGEIAERELSKR